MIGSGRLLNGNLCMLELDGLLVGVAREAHIFTI